MVTLESLRDAWEAASAAADAKRPTYIRILQRSAEFLIPTDDGRPIMARCRCCGSIQITAVGPKDNLADANLHLSIPVTGPCGYCAHVILPCNLKLAGIREMHAHGQVIGMGGKATPGRPSEPVEKPAEHEEEPDA